MIHIWTMPAVVRIVALTVWVLTTACTVDQTQEEPPNDETVLLMDDFVIVALELGIETDIETVIGSTRYTLGDWDYYMLDLPAVTPGDSLDLRVWSTGDTDTIGLLTVRSNDSDNTLSVLVRSDDIDPAANKNFELTHTLDPGVAYYVVVRGNDTGEYKVHFLVNRRR